MREQNGWAAAWYLSKDPKYDYKIGLSIFLTRP